MSAADVAVHEPGPRTSWTYPTPPAPHDPEGVGHDVTTGWPVIVLTLLLVPPLGALQLRHRTDVPLALRVCVALLALVVVVLGWVDGLRLLA